MSKPYTWEEFRRERPSFETFLARRGPISEEWASNWAFASWSGVWRECYDKHGKRKKSADNYARRLNRARVDDARIAAAVALPTLAEAKASILEAERVAAAEDTYRVWMDCIDMTPDEVRAYVRRATKLADPGNIFDRKEVAA